MQCGKRKWGVSLLLLLTSLLCMAQTKTSNKSRVAMRPPVKVSGGFIALSVPDLEASAHWYEETLGLKVVKHAVSADKQRAVTILQAEGLIVELIWFADAAPLSKIAPQLQGPHQLYGILKAGIVVDDLDAMLRALKAKQVTMAFEPFFDDSTQCRTFAVRDNNGNIIQFFGK